MTKEEAIQWIQLDIDMAKFDPTTGEDAYLNDDAKNVIEALEMAISALKAQMYGDTISRQAAITEIAKWMLEYGGENEKRERVALKHVANGIKNMPSAHPEERTEKRTETHACDLISRQAAMSLAKDICVPTKDGSVYRHRCIDPDDILELPSAQPDNQVNLCDSCRYAYPDCPSGKDDVIFGNGIGNDNICACNKYEPSAQLEPSIIHCEDCRFRYKSPDWKHRQSFGKSIWYCGRGRGLNFIETVELDDYCSSAKRRTNG